MKKHICRNPVGVSKYTGLLLILPFAVGAVLFILYPFVSSFILGMTDYSGVGGAEFTGLRSYLDMLADSDLTQAAGVTVRYALILVPLKLTVSLLVALLLSCEIRGIGVFRTVFYIPSILGANLAVVIMWQYLFKSSGLVNQFLGVFGISPVSWYGDSRFAMLMIVLLRLWEFGSTMVIFLTALNSIPREYYEAARVDGCGRVRAFFSITLPQLRSVIFINLVLQTIAAFQEFNAPFMLTDGGPLRGTYTLGMLIYQEMFRYSNVGYANAVSWALFAAIAAVVGLMFVLLRRKGEDER
ncbi:MAG: sugar ABC transporter permease [Ruminococcus sp.]|nr:sugar ABC transporter permease [Ruminococcus sp.]